MAYFSVIFKKGEYTNETFWSFRLAHMMYYLLNSVHCACRTQQKIPGASRVGMKGGIVSDGLNLKD